MRQSSVLPSLLPRLVAATALLMACSSDTEPATAPANEKIGDIHTDEVWKDRTKLTGLVRIFQGATVEIEPGAKISCLASAQIQIGGTLRVKGGGSAKHALISCEHWVGLVVANGGQLDITGLDLENPDVGIETTKGAENVNVSEMNITASPRPFLVRAGSSLAVTKVKATTPTTLPDGVDSVTEVFGKLTAKYLEYDANTNEGIMVMKDGEAVIEDSNLHGQNGLDLISSYGGKSLTVRYTTVKGSHCGIHVAQEKDPQTRSIKLTPDAVPTGSITVDHISSDNLFGITIYAASAQGPHSVKDSNLKGLHSWIDLQGNHGPITFQNVFTEGGETILCDGKPCPQNDVPAFNKAAARIDTAQPR